MIRRCLAAPLLQRRRVVFFPSPPSRWKSAAATTFTSFADVGWEDDDELLKDAAMEYDDLPVWTPGAVSRISTERLKVMTLPTLDQVAAQNVPAGAQDDLSDYAAFRRQTVKAYIRTFVQEHVVTSEKIDALRALASEPQQQDAVDELYEQADEIVRDKCVYGADPRVEKWTEQAVETLLRRANSSAKNDDTSKDDETATSKATPVFMDLYNAATDEKKQAELDETNVREDTGPIRIPHIVHPLYQLYKLAGNMVEEWALSAHDTSQRIMIRDATVQLAQSMLAQSNILVTGEQGVGKTAAVAAAVAAARQSGHIVWYLPYGDSLCQHGYYVEPRPANEKEALAMERAGFEWESPNPDNQLYDTPMLTAKVISEFLKFQQKDLADMHVPHEWVTRYLTEEQWKAVQSNSNDSSDSDSSSSDEEDNNKDEETIDLCTLLQAGVDHDSLAPPIYEAAIFYLQQQQKVPFWMVLDQYNCYHTSGHYFHASYDQDVKRAIPYEQISLFRPAMKALGLTGRDSDDEPVVWNGGVLAAVTESHAVPKQVTRDLVARAMEKEDVTVIKVPRLSRVETDHMLSNYEAIGVGKLRMDQGATVMNEQHVSYLHTVSGGVPQKLMDACIM